MVKNKEEVPAEVQEEVQEEVPAGAVFELARIDCIIECLWKAVNEQDYVKIQKIEALLCLSK